MGAHPPMYKLKAMESSFVAVNSANAASFGANSKTKGLATVSLYISTHTKCKVRFISRIGNTGLSSLCVRACKDQDMKRLNSKDTLTVSPSPSTQRLSMPLAAPPSSEHPRTLTFGHLMSKEHDHVCLGRQVDMNLMQRIVEKLMVMKLILHDNWPRHSEQLKSKYMRRFTGGRKGLISLIAAIICLTCPIIVLTDISIGISDNVALAQPIGQIRQAAVFLERFAGGSTSTRVLDKVVTVLSGQTVVTPETVEQLKSIIDGDKDTGNWLTDLSNKAETILDVVSHFDPLSLMEATGNSIQGLVEVGAERFAAFELSSLIALGERWILWTPFVVIPMYWQMKRNRSDDNGGFGREKSQPAALEISEEAMAKAARVRNELERIELKASLLDLVYSLGKLAWQSSGTDQNMKRKQIDEILARLQKLNPTSSDLGNAHVNVAQIESTHTQPAVDVDVDGEWNLIYVSQASNQSQQTQFPSLDIPGIELGSLRQKLWRKGSSRLTLPASDIEAELMIAKNTAQVRLGPLGVVEISVQGSWENRRNGKSALVSFDTFSAKPIEVLGSLVREDFPPLDVSIPRTLQTSGEWETVYLDNSLRMNQGRTGQFYLFRKSK